MESSQKKKIGIIVGLEREKKLVPKCSNIFVEKGYGKKAYNASKKILTKKVDVLISFGLAKSIDTEIKNSNIVIPTKVFNEKGENFNTSKYYNKILKKKINQKIWNKNLLSVSKILEKNEHKHDKNIGIIDYGAGNVQSVYNAGTLRRAFSKLSRKEFKQVQVDLEKNTSNRFAF